jgi:hypothetical protein
LSDGSRSYRSVILTVGVFLMSLGIVVKGTEGIVLAADSRVTLTAIMQTPGAPSNAPQFQLPVNFDNATKLLTFGKPNKWIGAVTYGEAVIGTTASDLRTAQSYVPEFESGLDPAERLTVAQFSARLSEFFLRQWQDRMPTDHPGPGMTFVVAGFDKDKPYGSVYLFTIPTAPEAVERSPNDFGVTFGGQLELTDRILRGYDTRVLAIVRDTLHTPLGQMQNLEQALRGLQLTIPYHLLPLQDCIDLAIFLIRTTTTAQNLSIGIRGVGGAIDVAVITKREGLNIIQRKELTGETKEAKP